MTDNEIITALEHCRRTSRYVICNSDCPMYEYCESDVEEGEMNICGLALNLINCQKAEIERLEKILDKRCDMCPAIHTVIKEFADRLREREKVNIFDISTEGFVYESDIDDLVKEMTEEKDNA